VSPVGGAVLTTRVRLFTEIRLAAVSLEGPRLVLPSAVRVVDHDVGVSVARLLAARPCGAAVCCRRNVYRHLDDLIARAEQYSTQEHGVTEPR